MRALVLSLMLALSGCASVPGALHGVAQGIQDTGARAFLGAKDAGPPDLSGVSGATTDRERGAEAMAGHAIATQRAVHAALLKSKSFRVAGTRRGMPREDLSTYRATLRLAAGGQVPAAYSGEWVIARVESLQDLARSTVGRDLNLICAHFGGTVFRLGSKLEYSKTKEKFGESSRVSSDSSPRRVPTLTPATPTNWTEGEHVCSDDRGPVFRVRPGVTAARERVTGAYLPTTHTVVTSFEVELPPRPPIDQKLNEVRDLRERVKEKEKVPSAAEADAREFEDRAKSAEDLAASLCVDWRTDSQAWMFQQGVRSTLDVYYPGSTLQCVTGAGTLLLGQSRWMIQGRKVVSLDEPVSGLQTSAWRGSGVFRDTVSDGSNKLAYQLTVGSPDTLRFTDSHLPVLAETARLVAHGGEGVNLRANALLPGLLRYYRATYEPAGRSPRDLAISLLLSGEERERFVEFLLSRPAKANAKKGAAK